ncbi:hypothetical protein [Massilia sp. METH4]|uniref:hypothetical protein n=1 Tax=Massilia sp. METH4 TaxID=3123041 RepID=UPI0030D3E84D
MGEWLGTWWPWVVQGAGLLLLAYFGLQHRAASRSSATASPVDREPQADRDDPFARGGYSSAPAGAVPAPAARQPPLEPPVGRGKAAAKFDWQPLMSVLVTIAILASALYVILSNQQFPDAHQKWAFGAIGTIVGYWLKK